jgi:hypothetical protein
MNPQVKQKWVSALRSGEYPQITRRLHTDNGFCCLGVLCDLYGKENNVEWELECGNIYEFNLYVFQGNGTFLPLSVVEWSGLENGSPYVDGGKTLALLNDHGKTFEEIADVIEEQL